MHASIRERSRSEGGFTLIELLVVMIIIAILMAVAIPTFLSQKNNALKTQATGNIKQVVNAMESCAAQIPSGGYVEGTLDCSDATDLAGFEKSLSGLKIQPAAPTLVDQTQIRLSTSQQGYMVQRMIKDSGKNVFFAEVHTNSGGLYKVCKADSAFPDTVVDTAANADVTGTGDNDTKTCKTGKW